MSEYSLTMSVPEAGQILGIGRDAAYRAAERGEIPTLRLGRRLVVPVPKLMALLGAEPTNSESASATDAPIATTNAGNGGPRDDHSRTPAA